MNKKKVLGLVTALALVGAVGIGATLAYFTDQAEVVNTVTMGHVDINLTETTVVKNEDGEYEQVEKELTEDGLTFENVVPNQTVPKDPTVTVAEESEDAYVRVALEFTGLNDEQIAELMEGIEINDGWVKSGDYYYFRNKMTAGESATLFDDVTIPATWGNEMADKSFTIEVYAEAIQASNFEPVRDDNGTIIAWTVDGTANGQEVTVETYEKVTTAN